MAISTNPTRSRTCGEPRLLPRRTVVTTALVGRAAGRRVRLRGTGSLVVSVVVRCGPVVGVTGVTSGAILLGPAVGSGQRRPCRVWPVLASAAAVAAVTAGPLPAAGGTVTTNGSGSSTGGFFGGRGSSGGVLAAVAGAQPLSVVSAASRTVHELCGTTMPAAWAWAAEVLGVAQLLQLVVEGLLAGGEVVGLGLQRGGRERRLLHLGVEAEQPDDAAEQHQADQGHERHPGRADPAPGYDGQPGPGDALLGQPRRAARGAGGRGVLMLLLPWSLMRSTARSRTEAARGFVATSSASASLGAAGDEPEGRLRAPRAPPAGRAAPVDRVTAVNACLTSRSSSEW